MLCQVPPQLEVELNQAIHRHCDTSGLENLNPYVCEGRRQTIFAVDIVQLGNDRYYGEEDADKAVLEDADPDDLSLRI